MFAYLADYSHAAHWRSDVLESRQMTSGSATRVGARFHVVLGTRRWRTDRIYEVVDVIDDRSVVLEAETPGGLVTETLSIAPRGDGCVVRHRTHVRARGVRVLTAPAIRLALRRRGLRAGDELKRLLAL